MAAMGTMSIDRSGLSLAALVIDTEGFGTYYVDKAGLGRVGVSRRETLATASPFVHGQLRTAVVREESPLSLTLRVQSASSAGLDTAVSALEDALSQFVYRVTVTLDGVVKTWTAHPATWNSTDGLVAFERVMSFHEDLSISIPVYPVAS
jgi:hypothetical protein